MTRQAVSRSMGTFLLIWAGQLISMFGSGMTRFALGVWVYQNTGSATQLALISLFGMLPIVVLSPIAGPLIDRWNRRQTLIGSNLGAGLSILAIVVLFWLGQLAIWEIYLAVAINAACNAFIGPALSASVPLLVSKQHLGRANGLMQLPQAAEFVLAPVAGSILLLTGQLQGVLLADAFTFLFAVVTLLAVRIPQPAPDEQHSAERRPFLEDVAYGWHYLTARPGLLGLVVLWGCAGFLLGIASVLVTPLVLAFASPSVLGVVMSIAGSGMLVGSVVMGVWGGPTRRIYGVFGFMVLEGLGLLLCGVQASVPLFTAAAFTFFFGFPIVNGCTQAILQSKVAPAVQGRIFAISNMIAWASLPLGYLVAGPLADYGFEPLLVSDGFLAGSIGQIIGVGKGRGIGLLFIVAGILYLLVAAGGYLYARLRLVELELPDAIDEAPPIATQTLQPDSTYAVAP